jgi:glycosyltransferase involved in cell wall biosynthesis
MKRVLVCIPSVHAEKLPYTLESLEAQDYGNYGIRVLKNNTNLPIAESWNGCFQFIGHDYLIIAHDDDVYHKEFISSQVKFLEENQDCVAVFCGMRKPNGENINLPKQLKNKISLSELVHYTAMNWRFPLTAPTFTVRIWTAESCGVFDTKLIYALDMDYYLRLAKFGKIGFNAQVLCDYNPRGYRKDYLHEFFSVLEKYPLSPLEKISLRVFRFGLWLKYGKKERK